MAHINENLIETIIIEHGGKETVWEVIEEPARYEGRRAYLKGSTKYYEMQIFEAGLVKADKVTRTPA
jgi:hypothetical protein